MSHGGRARLLVATGNPGKAREIRRFLGDAVEVETLLDHPSLEPPEEHGESFEENARLKAEEVRDQLGLPVLADDSGLEVDALGGAPGVRSARYAEGTDRDRVEKLLSALAGTPEGQRSARFVCVMAFALPGQPTVLVRGVVEGDIAFRPSGEGGFGYDPVFVPRPGPRTMAEISPEEKQAISHRGEALRALLPVLRKHFSLEL